MTAVLECAGVTVRHGDVVAVERLDLVVQPGETVAILGPSGSGKTSLLYAIAGLVELTAGEITLDDEVVSTPARNHQPERRPVGLVFQNYALWPHMEVRDIVAYPLRRMGLNRSAAQRRAQDLLETVGIAELSRRRPAELSGGQQQRVGLARALARDAKVYLFDEPTAHLDATAKVSTLDEIRRRMNETGAAALYATHDSAEALAIADRVAIMRNGRVVQVDTARAVYERPIDLEAARLTGAASVLRATSPDCDAGEVLVDVAGTSVAARTDGKLGSGVVVLLVRPEWVSFNGPIAGTVTEMRFTGPHTDYLVLTAAGSLGVRVSGPPRLAVGESTGVTIERGWIPAG